MDQTHGQGLLLGNGDKVVTCEFQFIDMEAKQEKTSPWRSRVWQIFPCVCASLACIPFGLMLGWPSPTYPHMIKGWDDDDPSEFTITMDQSAMVAGFLMIGNDLATPFSYKSCFGAKYGLICGVSVMVAGWIVMWQATGIYWLLGSRLLVGIGCGYSTGQLKMYIKQMSEPRINQFLLKYLNLYNILGMVMAFAIGPFVTFQNFSLISIIISIFILFLIIFLPSTPRELIKSKNIKDAKRLLKFLKPDVNADQEISKIILDMTKIQDNIGFTGIIKDKVTRNSFFMFSVLVFLQQFTGLPATLVYCQILFEKSHVPNSIFIALIYVILFLLSNALGMYLSEIYNKKIILLISCTLTTVVTAVKICVIFFEVNENYFEYTSAIVMYVFVIVNGVGLGTVPVTMIGKIFPKNCHRFVGLFYIMWYCLGALMITKLFQTLLYQFDTLYVNFSLYFCVSFVSIGFVLVFVPKNS